jgi:hypothetical protein
MPSTVPIRSGRSPASNPLSYLSPRLRDLLDAQLPDTPSPSTLTQSDSARNDRGEASTGPFPVLQFRQNFARCLSALRRPCKMRDGAKRTKRLGGRQAILERSAYILAGIKRWPVSVEAFYIWPKIVNHLLQVCRNSPLPATMSSEGSGELQHFGLGQKGRLVPPEVLADRLSYLA